MSEKYQKFFLHSNKMSCYASISEFGASNDATSNPLSICAVSGLDAGFNSKIGSSMLNPNGAQCQAFMPQYCATVGWDGVCEYKSHDMQRSYPNTQQNCLGPNGSCMGSGIGTQLTNGQMLVRNTAAEKYLTYMSENCRREYQPFDPTDANSPLISKWVAAGDQCNGGNCDGVGKCIPIYDVNPKHIDNDPVMNKILNQPWIAMDILVNIFNNRKRNLTLHELNHTKLGQYFTTQDFQNIVNSKLVRFS